MTDQSGPLDGSSDLRQLEIFSRSRVITPQAGFEIIKAMARVMVSMDARLGTIEHFLGSHTFVTKEDVEPPDPS